MALATFAPSIRPDPTTAVTPQINVRRAAFGDGYVQASPSGLNHIRRVAEVSWPVLTQAQMQELEAFFVARGGYQSFRFTLWGDVERKWTCADWSSDGTAPYSFRATLEESFTNET